MKVGIIGLGYVGLPLGLVFAENQVDVIGFDTDSKKIAAINEGKSFLKHIEASRVASAVEAGHLVASNDFSQVQACDAIIICVPTPLNRHREPDLTYVEETGRTIAPFLKEGVTVVLESTTYPGTTDGLLREILETASGKTAGKDFFLAFSPEREDPGNPDSRVQDMPKIVGGYTEACLAKAVSIYELALKNIVPVASCRVAEATKLTENIFRSVNIALVNEMKILYDRMGIDVWDVIDAAATKPFGYMPFYPGPGLGGHCIPIDPFYLTWKAREYGLHTRFIELAGEVNNQMPDYVVGKIIQALNDQKMAVNGAKILLLGLAYKPNVDDIRESPTFTLMNLLKKNGAEIYYNDPNVPEIPKTRRNSQYAGLKSAPISGDYDLLVVCTHHQEYIDYDFSKIEVPVVDTRNCIKKHPSKYIKA